jgi:TonB family protein
MTARLVVLTAILALSSGCRRTQESESAPSAAQRGPLHSRPSKFPGERPLSSPAGAPSPIYITSVTSDTSGITPPVLIHRVAPSWPKACYKGVFVVEVVISESGDVVAARMLRGQGNESFDTPVLPAVRQWKYRPALRKRTPVPVQKVEVLRCLWGSLE